MLPPVGEDALRLVLIGNVSKYFLLISQYILHLEPAAIFLHTILLQCIDNSTHIAMTIINISSGSIRINGHCSDIWTLHHHVAGILSEVLTCPHLFSKYILPSTIGATALNYSYLKKAIQYVLSKTIHQTW